MSCSSNWRIAERVAPDGRRPGDRRGASAGRDAAAPTSARRRELLLALAAAPALALPRAARAAPDPSSSSSPDAASHPASHPASRPAPGSAPDPLAGLQRWGSGEFRRFGLLVYEATLWAGDDPSRPPLALRLDYRRRLDGRAIADASVGEMRRFVADEAQLRRWGEQMARIFPDVKPGDAILGAHRGGEARFYQGGRLIGAIGGEGFADAFFGIWLDARTSAPGLRAALLRRG